MSNKRIITISRQFGSGGRTIGKTVAQMLGIDFYDKELVERVAKESGYSSDFVEEQGEYAPTTSSFLFNLAFSSSWNKMTDNLSPADQLYVLQNNIIREIADEKPCVIVGRCANYILKDRDDVLNVYIYADAALRARRIVERYGENSEKPEVRIKKKDEKRNIYIKHYTGQTPGFAANYDISLDSGKLSEELCAKIIAEIYNS